MSDPLLHTKLMPPRLQPAVIQRAGLLDRLDAGMARKLTLISAPTGYGKTTLVSQWIASRGVIPAWVTLDENDNDPSRFWTYLVSALRTLDQGVGKPALSALAAPQPPSTQALLVPLINELERLKPGSVLVLDEVQSITAGEILQGLTFLIQHLPETLHLVLISRSEPALPLGILRARGDLEELTAVDLRFNAAETQSFLSGALTSALPPGVAERLTERTDGWAAGLRLAALSLRDRDPAEIEAFTQAFSGGHRYVSDYLIKEVFESQPAQVQDFLLKTCFLTRLTPSLVDAVTETDGGAAMLAALERGSLFTVQLEHAGGQTWYRYNPLFAESIQALARQRLDGAAVQGLFEKASDWYGYHGSLDEAIETALSAGLHERALTLIEAYLDRHDLRELRTLARWLAAIPQPAIFRRPLIAFTGAQIILYSSDRFNPATAAKLEPYLRAAEAAWRAEENHARLGQLLSFRGTLVWWQGDLQKAFRYARQSLEELPEQDVFWRGNSLLIASHEAFNAGRMLDGQGLALEARALLGASQNIYAVLAADGLLVDIFYWQGELEQAEALSQQILTEAVGDDSLPDDSMLDDQSFASLNLAHIAYERGLLDQAEAYAARALNLGQQRANGLAQAQAGSRLAAVRAAKNDLTGALELLKSLEGAIQNPVFLRELQNARALLAVRSGDLAALAGWEKMIAAENAGILPLQRERETFILARLRIAQGQTGEALELLRPWKLDAAENGRARSQVEALILETLAQQAGANLPESVRPLVDALALGKSKGYRRLFLDEGARLARLFQAVLPMIPNRSLHLFASSLLHAFTPAELAQLPAETPRVQIEPLSQQELRVLRLLVAGLSNLEIAQELVVSTNTIKTQVKSIYRKLDVNSREGAREAASELRLLS